MRSSLVTTLALLAIACAQQGTPARWAKTGDGDADLETARTLCREQAEVVATKTSRDRYQAEARAGEFMRCMRAQGWEQVSAE